MVQEQDSLVRTVGTYYKLVGWLVGLKKKKIYLAALSLS